MADHSDGLQILAVRTRDFDSSNLQQSLAARLIGSPLRVTLRILLVENHDDTLTWLTRYLQQLGHEVCGVRDIASAIEAISSSKFEVLISDIGLPDGDGWQLLRQMEPKPFGIAMSGLGSRSDREKSLAAGYKRHLTKPFLPDDLDALLEEAAVDIAARV